MTTPLPPQKTTRLLSLLAATGLAATAMAWGGASAWRPALPLAAVQPEDAPASTEPAERTPADQAQPQAQPEETISDPEVDRIIEDLERAADRAADTRIAPPPTPAAAAGGNLLREGTFLRSRRGRIVRDDAGDWVFRFDSDGQSPITDPPMVLMPCQALMAMEAIAQRHGDAATFTVSGDVFVYHNRNYLLPRMYLVNRATDEVLPGQ